MTLTDRSTGSISGIQGKGNSGKVISFDIETERNKPFLKLVNWKMSRSATQHFSLAADMTSTSLYLL